MSQDIGKIFFNAQKTPKPHLGPICSGFRTFWHLKKWFWVSPQLNFGARGHESCQNGHFCKFLIFGFPELADSFFKVQMGLDGFI